MATDHEPALDHLPAIVWQADPSSGRFTRVSGAAEALLGYPRALWLTDGFWAAHLHPDDVDRVVRRRAEAIRGGRSISIEYRMIAADGRAVWLRDAATVEVDGDRPVQVHGVLVDVSDRHAVVDDPEPPLSPRDRALAILKGLFQQVPIGLALFDRELRFLRINDRLAAINGVPAEASRGRRLDEIVPHLAARVGPILHSVFASGQAAQGLEIRGETAAEPGRSRCWRVDYLPIRAGGDEVFAVASVVVEVTARELAEEALRASEARYRALYQRTPAMMHSIDHEGRLVDVSDAWLERLGYAREEVVGRASVDFLTAASRAYAEAEVLPEFFRSGVVRDIPYHFVHKDGAVLDILLSGIAERDAQGRFLRSLAVLVDVTERNRTEEALRRSEDQLRQAQKMEAIGRLAGGVAHDFNNLLVVILGHAELLLEDLTDPELRDAAAQITLAGERAATLTRQILTFSRQQVVQPRILDLNGLIRDTEQLLRRLLRADIEVTTRLQPTLGQVCVDAGQVTQVLMNLAVNASDAMPAGGRLLLETADVGVDALGECAPGEYVRLTVTDTGTGMDDETRARLFEPFFTTKEAGRGTGLGLAIVYGIVHQHRGSINVTSAPGEGASFRIYLPRVTALPEAARAAPTRTIAPPLRRPITVLVAEDDAMVRRLVGDALSAHGYEVLAAADADEAIQALAAHAGPVDVVLTDAVMPGTAPAILVGEVRARNPQARVIYMSGYAAPRRDVSPIDARDTFLPKPFTTSELLRTLESAGPSGSASP
ncbi:MAG: PAS domain S-box protein [Nannocystaceae bacterium]